MPQARHRVLEHRHARLEVALQDEFVRQFGVRIQAPGLVASPPAKRDGLGIGGCRSGKSPLCSQAYANARCANPRLPGRPIPRAAASDCWAWCKAASSWPSTPFPKERSQCANARSPAGRVRGRGQRRLQPAVNFRIS